MLTIAADLKSGDRGTKFDSANLTVQSPPRSSISARYKDAAAAASHATSSRPLAYTPAPRVV